jgi:hypothetical protein
VLVLVPVDPIVALPLSPIIRSAATGLAGGHASKVKVDSRSPKSNVAPNLRLRPLATLCEGATAPFSAKNDGGPSIHRKISSRLVTSAQSRRLAVAFRRNEKNRTCVPLFHDASSTLRAWCRLATARKPCRRGRFSTISNIVPSSHWRTAQCFLQHLKEAGTGVGRFGASQIESYIAKAGTRLTRASLQHDIAALKEFLRFLTTVGRLPAGLNYPIDTPRLYRLEQLRRALPWETICALLRSMETASPMGLRDYAMFLLIATYGLRASEIVATSLDDIRWKQRILRIHHRVLTASLPAGSGGSLAPAITGNNGSVFHRR